MVLAVNFKQTALYFALPFVIYTVARLSILYHNENKQKVVEAVLKRCVILGMAFIMTNLVLWLPWLLNFD